MGEMCPANLMSAKATFSTVYCQPSSCSVSGPHLSTIIVWSFLASYGFFSTGHQATIPSIRFEAAFIGFQGHTGTMIIPGTVIYCIDCHYYLVTV